MGNNDDDDDDDAELKASNWADWYDHLHAFTRHIMTTLVLIAGFIGAWVTLDLPIPASKSYVITELKNFSTKFDAIAAEQKGARRAALINKLATLELSRTFIQSELFSIKQFKPKEPSTDVDVILLLQRREQNLTRALSDVEIEIAETKKEIDALSR